MTVFPDGTIYVYEETSDFRTISFVGKPHLGRDLIRFDLSRPESLTGFLRKKTHVTRVEIEELDGWLHSYIRVSFEDNLTIGNTSFHKHSIVVYKERPA